MNDLAPDLRRPCPAWLRSVVVGVLAIAVFSYAIFLQRHISPHAGGSDSSGYLNSARLLSHGKLSTMPRPLPGFSANFFGSFSNVPLGFLLRPDGHMAPTYPTGYALQLWAASVFGWSHAAIIVNLGTALLTGYLLFLFCRKLGISDGLSLGGVALLWLCPLFLFSVFQPMSDLSGVCASLIVLSSALLARDQWKNAVWCGAALSIAVLIRPSNLLLALPVLVALGFRLRSWLLVGLGGLPGAAFFGFYNWQVYGSPIATGYGDVSAIFSRENLPHNLAHFSHWIPILLSPLIVLAVAAPFVSAGRQRAFAVLAVWAITLIGFYAFYYHAGETWWYLRFILPAFPALIIGAMLVLETGWHAAKSRPIVAGAVLTLLLISGLGWQLNQFRPLDVLFLKANERTYPDAALWAKQKLPANSVIFCMQVSGAFFYYTDFLLFRWEQIAPEKYNPLLTAIAEQNRPIYAALFEFETTEALKEIGGHWTKLSTVGQVTFWQRQSE